MARVKRTFKDNKTNFPNFCGLIMVFSMTIGFILMLIGGYGFAGNMRAGMDGPFMPPVNATVQFDKLSFFLPIVAGIIMFVSGIFSVARSLRLKVLQGAMALCAIILLFTGWDIVIFIRLISASAQYYPLEVTIRAETALLCLLYLLWGLGRLRSYRLSSVQQGA